MTLYTTITVSDEFRNFIKRQNYEQYVYAIVNKSTKIFREVSFTKIEEQSHGECDFIDSHGIKYDVKLLFNQQQGQLIGNPKNTLIQWIQKMENEKTEFSKSITERDLSYVESTKLYMIMRERIQSLEADENAILFIPYPIVQDLESSIFLQFATDFCFNQKSYE